jgi:hypothetical protein
VPDSLFARRWLPLIYAAVLLVAAWSTHFAVLINDVFALRWQAEHLSISHPESFYNGFFPIGYPLLLRAASVTGNPVLTMMLIQIALAPLYAALVYRLLVRLVPGRSVAIVFPLALFAPPVIKAVLSATPDFFAAFAVLAGFLWMTREGRWNFVVAGVCIGLGCVFRSHLLALAIALALALLLFQKEFRFRAFFGFCAGVLSFVIAQGLVQVWSGHGFFENAQAFNIWKTMHGMDWNNPPALGHASAFRVILDDPAGFFASVENWLFRYAFYFVPLMGFLLLAFAHSHSNTRAIARPLTMLAFASLVYLLLTSAGGSVSAFTPVIPIAAACIAALLDGATARLSNAFRNRAIPTLAAIVWVAGFIGLFIFILRVKTRTDDYAEVQRMLDVRSDPDVLRIYTDDFDFYFPNLRYRIPRASGGWPEVGLPHYLEEFPHIRNTSSEIEHHDLIQNGIVWAIYRVPPYDPRGYQYAHSDTSLFRLMYRTRSHEIYRVEGGERK